MRRACRQIVFEPRVRTMDDLVDGIGSGRGVGMVPVPRGQLPANLVQPFVEKRLRARIQRRKRADDSGLALRHDQRRPGYDEQWRAHRRQPEGIENLRKRHRACMAKRHRCVNEAARGKTAR